MMVVTNQSEISRGYFPEDQFGEIHNRVEELRAEKGARVDDIFCCTICPKAGAIAGSTRLE